MHRPYMSTASAPAVGRTAHPATLRQAGPLALARHRSLHQDPSRAPSRSAYAKCGSYRYPFPARDLGSWLYSDFHQRWLKLVLLRFDSSFWTLARRKSSREDRTSVAGRSEADLRLGEEKLPAAQAGSGHAHHAPRGASRSHGRLAGVRLLGSAEHIFH